MPDTAPIVHSNRAGLPVRTADILSADQKRQLAVNHGNGSANSPRLCHTGGCPAAAAADFNNSTPVITEIYLAEVFIPVAMTLTGIAHFNGSDVTDLVKSALFDAAGALIAKTAVAGTQASGTDAYQRVPFTATVTVDPGTYYVACMYNGTTSRFNTHVTGNFGAGKLTGHVFATAFDTTALTGLTMPTTFTTALGPVATLY